MIKSEISKEFKCNKNKLWDVITNNSDYSWRSDLSKIEILDDTHFVEYTKGNYPTYFTITKKEKLKEYKFDMKNTNINGTWTGIFNEMPNGVIKINFTEEVEVNSFVMKLLAKIYLKKQQQRYMKDLEQKINT